MTKEVLLEEVNCIEQFAKPLEVTVCFYGPGCAYHNMPCPIISNEHAVLNTSKGVFEPSWKAQQTGWRLLRVRPGREWLFELLAKFIFFDHTR